MGSIDDGMVVCGKATVSYPDTAFTTSGSELSLGSCTHNQEADESEAEQPSGSETELIPDPYSCEPIGTESYISSQNTRDDSDHNKPSDMS